MRIQELMTTEVRTCSPTDSLSTAAQAMWDGDCGSLPVIDAHRRVVGMITDRDVCMAAHLRGAPLWALQVGEVMSKVVYACRADDKLSAAGDLMAEHRLRRLPVVDGEGRLTGIFTLTTLAHLLTGKRRKKSSLQPRDVVELVAAVTTPRTSNVPTRSVIEVRREAMTGGDGATLEPKPRAAKPATAAVKPAPAPVKPRKVRIAR